MFNILLHLFIIYLLTNAMTDKLYLCIDVIQIICDFADIKTQLNLTSLSQECYDRIKIRQLSDKCATQDVIRQKKFNELQKLNVRDNPKITDVNHLANTLIELDCGWNYIIGTYCNCGIDQKGISDLLKLQKLVTDANATITDVNHLRNTLIELDCADICGIDQKGIADLLKLQN